MGKEFESVVTIVWDCNNFEAETKEDYIAKVKASFFESYGIDLLDSEITDIKEIVYE
jgi:hypothetical protein